MIYNLTMENVQNKCIFICNIIYYATFNKISIK